MQGPTRGYTGLGYPGPLSRKRSSSGPAEILRAARVCQIGSCHRYDQALPRQTEACPLRRVERSRGGPDGNIILRRRGGPDNDRNRTDIPSAAVEHLDEVDVTIGDGDLTENRITAEAPAIAAGDGGDHLIAHLIAASSFKDSNAGDAAARNDR